MHKNQLLKLQLSLKQADITTDSKVYVLIDDKYPSI
jgi:hypothetical protein